MKTAIIGAGKMGAWFIDFFLGEGDSVVVSDKDKEKLAKIQEKYGVETINNIDAVKNADRILICVPIENFEETVKEVRTYIQPSQTIMDICSIKEFPVKMMHKYIKSGIILGTHPVFGPGSKSLKNKKIILTPITKKEREFAESVKLWLEKKLAKVFIMSPRKHDDLMSIVLGFPHFLGLVICDTLLSQDNILETRRIAGPSYKMLLTLAEAVALEKTEFYANLQLNLPKIEQVEELFLNKSQEWLNIIKRKDKSSLINKMEHVKSKMMKANPDHTKSYETMYKMLEAIEN